MGQQTRYEERPGRFRLRMPFGRKATRTDAGSRGGRLARYGLRALLIAGAAGAVWFLSSQAADAAPAHGDTAAPAHAGHRDAGLLATTRTVGSLAGSLIDPDGCAVGDRTCGRPSAGPHHGTDRSHAAQVATSPSGARRAAPGAADADRTAVPAGGVETDAAGIPGVTADAGSPGQSLGHLAGAARPVVRPVLDAARPVAGPVDTVVRTVAAPRQGAVGASTGALRPVTGTAVHRLRSLTGALTGPLVDATRPVTGLAKDTVRPLPGVCGAITAPLTGALTDVTGPLSGITVPTGPSPILAPDHPAGTSAAVPPRRTAVVRWADPSSATWTTRAGTATDRQAGTPVPAYPGPTPPAYPGSGLITGSVASPAGSSAAGGTATSAALPATRVASASRASDTAGSGLPRLAEVDPVVTPD